MGNDYHYPGTTVLRNQLGYTDPHALAQAEALIAATRMAELAANPIDGHVDFAHLQAIHRHLLGDLYEWAGEIRTIDTAPGDLGILDGTRTHRTCACTARAGESLDAIASALDVGRSSVRGLSR